MTTGQADIKIRDGKALDIDGTVSNVATNQAELAALKAANVDNKDIYPKTVTTDHFSASDGIFHGAIKSGSLMVGSGGVTISSAADGATPTTGILLSTSVLQLIKSGVATVTLDGTTGDATFKGTIVAGSSISGTMTAGSIFCGSGGVVISSAAGGAEPSNAGIFMGITGGAPQIYLKNAAGTVTVRLNGADGSAYFAGQVVTSNVQITDSATNSMNLQSGTVYLGTSVTIGAAGSGRTLANVARTFYQTTAPSSGMLTGDFWVDSDDANLTMYRYNGSSWTVQAVSTTNHTYAQAAAPSSGMVAGDFWVDTDDGNKLYRYSGASWVAYQDTGAASGATAIQPGGGVAVDGSKYITTIDMSSGIVIKTSTSTAKTQMTADGIAIYNSAGTVVVQADHTNGLWVNNVTSPAPGLSERASFAYSGTEEGYIYAINNVLSIYAIDQVSIITSLGAQIQCIGSGEEVRLTGDTISLIGPVSASGDYTAGAGQSVKAIHKTIAGANKGDTTFTFYAASSSGGSPTVLHTVTFADGLITSWSAA